jgi:hypothetical protein
MTIGASGSQAQSSSFNAAQSVATNQSMNAGSSFGMNQSFIDPVQGGYLQDMWRQASGAADAAGARRAASGAAAGAQPYLQGAMNSTAQMMDPSRQIAAQSGSLRAGLGRMFRDEINPAIRSDAISAGGFGGGRQGVAQGVATGQLADAYTQGYGDIVAGARGQALQAAGMMPGLADARYQMAMRPYGAGMDQLSQLASILGGPAILNMGRTGSSTVGQSLSRAASESRGGSKASEAKFGFNLGL